MKTWAVIFFYFFTLKLTAQNPAFFILGEKEFANKNIYSLLIDETNDILYVTTNKGAYVYKQNKFLELKLSKNQIGSSLFSLKQNVKGQVFCSNLNGQIFKVKNDSLVIFYENSAEVKNLNYFFVKNSLVLISSANKILLVSEKGKVLKTIFEPKEIYNPNVVIKTATQLEDSSIAFTCSNQHSIIIYKNNKIDSLTVDFRKLEAYSKFFTIQNTLFSICHGGNVNSSLPNIVQNYTPHNKEQVYKFSKNELIGLNQKKGVHFLTLKNDTLSESQHFFDNTFISTYCKKSNGMLFFGSFGGGVYVMPNRNLLLQEYEYHFSGMTMINDVLYLSTRSGEVFKFENELKIISTQDLNIDNIFTIFGPFNFNEIPQKGLIYTTKTDVNYDIKDIVQIDSSFLILATSDGLSLRTAHVSNVPQNLSYIKKKKELYSIFNETYCKSVEWSVQDSLIFYSTNFGVYAKEWGTSKTTQFLIDNKPFSASGLIVDTTFLICATNKNGVLFFKDSKIVLQLNTQNGLKSNIIKKIILKNKELFILSQEGMQIYNIEKNKLIDPNIRQGPLSSPIKNFSLSKDKIWLLEKNKFYSVQIKELYKNESIGYLHIDSTIVNNLKINQDETYTFNYDQNKFTFYFDYRDFETKAETKINYTLEGFNTEWLEIGTTNNKIIYDYLPSGKYTFKINAIYKDQKTEMFEYNFEILLPFWQTWWFYLGVLIGVIIIVSLIIYSIKKKNQLILNQKNAENNAINSKLIAIRAQMNPHFIFNSINSIQDLILKKDTLKSYDYLVQFSELVRNALEYSEKEFIQLENEISFLETYLNLEKLRFKDEFSYKITSTIHNSILIPTLITQPFVENAIKHGLLHKEGKKSIHIDFSITDNHLICKITDNGIGRKKSKAIKDRQKLSYKSFSTLATTKRLAILEEKLEKKCFFIINDLHDNMMNSLGTEIRITLPKL